MGNSHPFSALYHRGSTADRIFGCRTQSVLPKGMDRLLFFWLLESMFNSQSLLWMEPDHPIVILRLAFVFLCALPAVRELYQYVNDPR